MDSTQALELADIPASLLVIGGGYIGLEMGTVYAEIGSRVSVVELTDTLLPGADRDLVKPLAQRLEKLFEKIHLRTKVVKLEDRGGSILVHFEGPEGPSTGEFSRVLVAVGRRPNSDGIGLENTAVRVSPKGFVEVDGQQRTADPKILAIGDVCGEPMLAHRASHQGKVAVEALHGEPALFAPRAIPAVVFTDPEIAWAGLTEQEAAARGLAVEVSRYPWAASGRAQALGRTEGMTKILVDPESDTVLGVGMVGPGAGELVAEGVLAIEMGCSARDLSEAIHPHPTLGETVAFSAENYFGLATEIYRPRAESAAR
jgi:dihydrolipoamide dehydrogenase